MWIQTYTGKKFSLINPQPEDVNITDIIESLSKQCRFVGHCNTFYSVAQHSVLVSNIVKDKFAGLMHDAAEAYTGDTSKPLKVVIESLCGKSFREILNRIEVVVADAFGLSWPPSLEIKEADLVLLVTEKRDLMLPSDYPWMLNLPNPLKEKIIPLSIIESNLLFREQYLKVQKL